MNNFTEIETQYFENAISQEELRVITNYVFDYINKFIGFSNLGSIDPMNSITIDYPKTIEKLYSVYLNHNKMGLKFRNGFQNLEKDCYCETNPEYSIEIKTHQLKNHKKLSSKPMIIGNKCYAKDNNSSKSHDSYYILVNYIMDSNGIITLARVWFSYINKSDWCIENKDKTEKLGNSSSLSNQLKDRLNNNYIAEYEYSKYVG